MHRKLLQRDGEQPHPPACEGGNDRGRRREEEEEERRRRGRGRGRGRRGGGEERELTKVRRLEV